MTKLNDECKELLERGYNHVFGKTYHKGNVAAQFQEDTGWWIFWTTDGSVLWNDEGLPSR